MDGSRQDSFDLFLGRYRPDDKPVQKEDQRSLRIRVVSFPSTFIIQVLN